MKNTNTWFSLIEILLGMLIVSIIMVSAFQALSAVWIAKVKLIERTKIEKQAYFATEKFFEMIKKWGTIDYEEYWNRYSHNTLYDSGYFDITSGFWNFWDNTSTENTNYGRKPYYCLSWPGTSMWTDGCLIINNIRFGWGWINELKSGSQRYGQYEQQFIDRNSDEDGDSNGLNCTGPDSISRLWTLWDENCDGSILWDDDDLFLGIWPAAFIGSSITNKVWELYLINGDGNERTYFRWNVGIDPDAISGTCLWWEAMIGTACLWTIEFLKLTGQDYWYDHDFLSVDADGSQWDGEIDTWLIHDDFSPLEIVAGSNAINYWQAIFPDSIHVSDVEFYVYPNKDLEYSWRDTDTSIFVAPYIQIKMTLQPSLKEKSKIKWAVPIVNIATTIQLSSLDLK
jgi:prepilin-type N-terminal cleavage/methylation domain-containing protein